MALIKYQVQYHVKIANEFYESIMDFINICFIHISSLTKLHRESRENIKYMEPQPFVWWYSFKCQGF
jgi:hypothetical protein